MATSAYTYPNLTETKEINWSVLLRIIIISFFILLIMLPLQLIVMVIYAPIAIWNAFTPPTSIKNTQSIQTEIAVIT